ncbi:MAG: hypothetical protein NVSMB21_15060 [Vulcanimicrobiaceae bacterium]
MEMMSASILSRDSRSRLASFLDESRRHLSASIARPLARSGSIAANAVATSFLERLSHEVGSADRRPLDVWAATVAASEGACEYARVVALACATVASAYDARFGLAPDVVEYIAVRATELESLMAATPPHEAESPAVGGEREAAVTSLLSALEARDAATCEHARAVGIWCGRMAKQLGMSPDEQLVATLAGTLHDVGKIATPTEVLLKAAALDDSEWSTMRAHARVGAKMLERVPSLREVAPFVRAHHERVDGTGYPDRLVGDAIPTIARIVSVADSFHAMISKRPYRSAMPVARALDELRRGIDTQFDRTTTHAMLAIVQPAGVPRPVRRVMNGTS